MHVFSLQTSKYVADSADGAKSMTGYRFGPNVKFQEVIQNALWSHCFFTWRSFWVKILPSEMEMVSLNMSLNLHFHQRKSDTGYFYKMTWVLYEGFFS